MTDAGLRAELRTEGEPIALTPGIDLVAYRVIETAFERAAASMCRRARLTIRYSPRQLELEIEGEPSLRDPDRHLSAVTERVELYGGSLDVTDTGPAGFLIRCRLPLEGVNP
jgi:hypothetical protein